MKTCSDCGEEKDLDSFSKSKAGKFGRTSKCKECQRVYAAAWRKDNKEERAEYNRKWREENRDEHNAATRKRYAENIEVSRAKRKTYLKANPHIERKARLKAKYNLTVEQYNQMLEDQNYACAICNTQPEPGKNLSVDHDHSCCPGEKSCGRCVRKLLCFTCNSGLGMFKERVDLLEKGLDYLRSFERDTG